MADTRGFETAELDRILESRWATSRVPGMTAAVADKTGVVYTKALGVTSLATGRAMTDRSLFCVASLSKPFVAVAVLQLVERGLADLDAPVQDYLPYFRACGRGAERMTIRHLLQHTSGFSHGRLFRGDAKGDDESLERAVRRLRFRRVRSAPGTTYSYSNLGFMVAGDLISKVSGEPFEAYIEEHILRPLGMSDSTYAPGNAPPELVTSGHMRTGFAFGKPRALRSRPLRRAFAPVGGLYTNVTDLGKWAGAHLQGGEFRGARILARESFQRLAEEPLALPNGSSIGLGWFLRAIDGRRAFGYVGTTLGYKAHILIDPGHGAAAILLCNALLEPTRELFDSVTAAALHWGERTSRPEQSG